MTIMGTTLFIFFNFQNNTDIQPCPAFTGVKIIVQELFKAMSDFHIWLSY